MQNAYDARTAGATGPVKVDYRLHRRRTSSGRHIHLLTVTDRNTTGLRGPALSVEDLNRRGEETGALQLRPDENWAAWEAMGYTKVGEDSLGSRGQGKAAFLYHSRHRSDVRVADGTPLERMIILYDSLLPDGTYRLGARLAQPADRFLSPPYEGEEAREIIRTEFAETEWRGDPVPLGLEPLTEVGTRIIVPYLSEDAVDAIESGELVRWLERCWWRAIQVGKVEITVGTESGHITAVEVPTWWIGEPWREGRADGGIYVQEDIPLEPGSHRRIKRIVLLYDPTLGEDEIAGYPPQYSGMQLLRGRQWIETLPAAGEKLGDYIPRDRRPGFRGFVEFDRQLEQDLREVEQPQHDGFNRQKMFVRQIDAQIRDAVREFAQRQGWLKGETTVVEDDREAEAVLRQIVDLFVGDRAPGAGARGRRDHGVSWTCELEVDFPHTESARVNWGESLRNIVAACRHEPAEGRVDVAFDLYLVTPTGHRTPLAERGRRTKDGAATAGFPDVTVARAAYRENEVACPEPGRYALRLECRADGVVVGSATRHFYVQTDPPAPEVKPYSVDIAVTNLSADRARVNHGDLIRIGITVTNRTANDVLLTVDASLEDLIFADGHDVTIPGRPAGDTPASSLRTYTVRVLTAPPEPPPAEPCVVLAPGRYFIRADVKTDAHERDRKGNIVASAAKMIFVEVDPEKGTGGTPFRLLAREEAEIPHPVWELEEPHGETNLWTLWYARHHPSYRAAVAANRARPDGLRFYGTGHFFAEIICAALVEWALRLYRDRGDDGGLRLLGGNPGPSGSSVWERYRACLDELPRAAADPVKYVGLQREAASLMLYLVHEELV